MPRTDAAKPLSDYLQSLAESQERQRQRDHELQMQREWLAAHESEAASPATKPLSEADIAQMYTSGLSNGLLWRELSAGSRTFYIAGFMEATAIQGHFLSDIAKQCKCGYGDISDGVTAFYRANPAYVRLPIAGIVKLHLMKATGSTEQVVNDEAARMAKITAELQQP